MEEQNIKIGESFKFLFNETFGKKALVIAGLVLLPVILSIITGILFVIGTETSESIMILTGGIFVIPCLISYIFSALAISGYLLLYAHDRALNIDAPLRDWSKETLQNSLLNGLKWIVMCIIKWPFGILFLPIIIFSVVVTQDRDVGNFVYEALITLIFGSVLTRIYAYFIKDLKIVSLFKWGKAFKFTKGVKGSYWVMFIPFVFSWVVSLALIFAIAFPLEIILEENMSDASYAILGLAVDIPIIVFSSIIYCNLLGQYTHNAIIQNSQFCTEEKLNSYEDSDGSGTVVAVVVALVAVFLITIFILGLVAALTIPSLVNRQNDLAAKVKMKKAISNYEDLAEVYMLEASDNKEEKVTDLKDFAGENCENINKYFKIDKSYDNCSFTTIDGVYWEINPTDGGAIISDDADNPRYTIEVGVCKNGYINCKEQYPQVSEFFRN